MFHVYGICDISPVSLMRMFSGHYTGSFYVYIFVIGDSSERFQRNWCVIRPLLWKTIMFYIKNTITGNSK